MQSNNVNVNSSQVSAHISMIMQKETKKHFHIFKEKFQNSENLKISFCI